MDSHSDNTRIPEMSSETTSQKEYSDKSIEEFMKKNQEVFLEYNGEDLEGTYSAVDFFPFDKKMYFEFESDNYGYTPEVGHVITDREKSVIAENIHSREEAVVALQARKEAALENASQAKSMAADNRANASENRLLLVLNSVRENRQERIDFLNQRNNSCAKKISRQERKISKLTARVDRLKMANETLKSLFGDNPPKPIQAIVNANENRAKKISESRIPKRENKISRQVGKIERNNLKIEKAQCTINKTESLSRLIKSFAIVNGVERRKEFSEAMHDLHYASSRAVGFKISKCENKLAELNKQYEVASTADKFIIGDKIARLNEKLSALNEKNKRYSSVETFVGQPDEALDKAANVADKEIQKYRLGLDDPEQSGQLESVSEFSENLVKKSCEALDENGREQPEKQLDISEIKEDISQVNDTLKSLAEQISRNNEISSEGIEQMKTAANAVNNSPMAKETPKATESATKNIIGNTKYDDIQNKFFVNLTPERAREVSEILDKHGIKHSGKIYSEKEAKITLDKADVKAFKQLTSKRDKTRDQDQNKEQPKQNRQKRRNEQSL